MTGGGRPLVVMLSTFLVGLLICAILSVSYVVVLSLSALFLIAGATVFFYIKIERRKTLSAQLWYMAGGLALAALLGGLYFGPYHTLSKQYDGQTCRIEGEIQGISRGNYYTSFTVRTQIINGEEVSANLRLTTYNADFLEVPLYSFLSCETVLSAPKSQLYGFDGRRYWFSRGVSLIGAFTEGDWQENTSPPLLYYGNKLQTYLGKQLVLSSAGEVKAVLLGDKTTGDETLEENMRIIGVSHIFSISGLHLTLLLSSVYLFLFRLRVPQRISGSIVILFALFYMVITGFSPSVSRAGIMAILYYLSLMIRRDTDSLISLLVSTSIICLLDPFSVCNIGLQLSFLATLGIFTLGVRTATYWGNKAFFSVKPKKGKNLLATFKGAVSWLVREACNLIIMNFAAILITLPVLLTVSDEISLISPFANLLLVPLFNPILILSALYLLCRLCIGFMVPVGVVFSFLSGVIGWLVDGLFWLFITIVNFLAGLDFAILFVNYPFLPGVIVVFIVILALCLAMPKWTKYYVMLPAVFALVFAGTWGMYTLLKSDDVVLYKITNRSDEKLLICDQGETVILESRHVGNAISSHTENTLKQNGIGTIDVYILPKLDKQAFSKVKSLTDCCPINKVFTPYPNTPDEYRIYTAINQLGIPTSSYLYGEDILFGRAVVRVYPRGKGSVWFVWEGEGRRICYSSRESGSKEGYIPEPEKGYDLIFLSGKVNQGNVLFASAAYTALSSRSAGEKTWLQIQDWFSKNGGQLLDVSESPIIRLTWGETIEIKQ